VDAGKLLVRSSFARVFGTLAKIGVAFFLMPFLIGDLGDRWYGIWVIIAGFSTYYYLLDFGLSNATSRFGATALAAGDEERLNDVLSTAMLLFVCMGLLVIVTSGVVAWSVQYFLDDPAEINLIRTIILIQGIGLGIGFSSKAFGGVAIIYLRYDLLEINSLIRLFLETVAIFYFLSQGYGVLALAVIGFVAITLHTLGDYFVANFLYPGMHLSFRRVKPKLAREFVGFSIWSFLINISDAMRLQLDALVIGAFAGAAMVTHYNIGARLAMYTLTLLNRATNMITPLYTRLHALQEEDGLRDKFILFTKINAMLGVFGGGALLLVGQAFIERWMGPEYLDAYPVLVVLAVAVMAESINQPTTNILLAIAKHKFYAKISIVEAICNVVLSIILLEKYGIVGVALGTTIPLLVVRLIIVPIYTCRQLGLSVRRYYLTVGPIISVILAYLGLWYAFAANWLSVPDFSSIVSALVAIACVYLLFIPFVVLTKAERASLWRGVTAAAGHR
jgi:O-antigen/teichoic acid export membrane protein